MKTNKDNMKNKYNYTVPIEKALNDAELKDKLNKMYKDINYFINNGILVIEKDKNNDK